MEFEDSKGRKYTVANGTIMYRGIECEPMPDGEVYLDMIDAIADKNFVEYILSHSFDHHIHFTSYTIGHYANDKYGIFATPNYNSIIIVQGDKRLQIDEYIVNGSSYIYDFTLNDKKITYEDYRDNIHEKIGKYLNGVSTKSARNFN